MGAKESVRPNYGLAKQVANISTRRVEAGPEVVVEEVVNDQSAQTTRKCPKFMRNMSNTTMIWAWSRRAKGKNFGPRYEETSQIAFALLAPKGTQAPTSGMGTC